VANLKSVLKAVRNNTEKNAVRLTETEKTAGETGRLIRGRMDVIA
jgi:hypothetical protein